MVAVASGNGYFCSSINPPRPTGGIRHNSNGGVGIYQKERAKKTKIIKAVVLFAIVALLIYVIADFASPRLGYFRRIFEQLVSWMEHNLVAGVFVFAFVFAVCTILFIPTPLLTFWAGFAFGCAYGLGAGTVLGSLSVGFGAFLGGVVSFLIGRFIFQDFCKAICRKFRVMRAIDAAVLSCGLKLMILLRLSPLIPFSLLNYALGATRVTLKDYCAGFFGIIPGTFAYVFVGASAGGLFEHNLSGAKGDDTSSSAEEEGDSTSMASSDGGGAEGASVENTQHIVSILIFAIGGAASLIAIVFVTLVARRHLKQILIEEGGVEASAAAPAAPWGGKEEEKTEEDNSELLEEQQHETPSIFSQKGG
mmetsp:Transcript_32970/g.48242  ORF Transcript_32970/g.48242 Transcript_32970/m.48242 type:complete len:364 (-) Transcript_32970:84-1175(-)